MTESAFKAGISFLIKMFGAKIDDEVYVAYWNILKTFDDVVFREMQQTLIKNFIPTSQVPFPVPAQFLSAAGVSGGNRSRLAVQAVIDASNNPGPYRSVSFGDPALHETIVRFGGWPAVASWDSDKWQFVEKSFVATYEANLVFNNGPSRLVGICEFENGKKSLSENHLAIAEKQNEVRIVIWVGFDRNLAIDKGDTVKKEISDLTDMISKIGNIPEKKSQTS
jgi:hypothetical protein